MAMTECVNKCLPDRHGMQLDGFETGCVGFFQHSQHSSVSLFVCLARSFLLSVSRGEGVARRGEAASIPLSQFVRFCASCRVESREERKDAPSTPSPIAATCR